MSKMVEAGAGKKTVVAVVGAAHVPGMTAQLGQPVDRSELERIPPPAVWWRIAKWAIPLAFLALLGYLATKMDPARFAETMLAWIIPTSIGAGAATLIAGGSIFSVISAIVAAPIARLYPLVRTAVVVGIVEAWRRKPSVQDCERLQDDVQTMKGFWRNPVTRILIIAVASSLGALLGFAVGVGVFATRL
jgi:pheromone shutdown protein TraB